MKNLMETSINPWEWGWKIVENKYVSIMTDEVRWLIKLILLPYYKKLRNNESNPLQPGIAFLYPLKTSENF